MRLFIFATSILVLNALSVESCNNEDLIYTEIFNEDGRIEDRRFYNCKINNLNQVSEVRVLSCLSHLEEGTFDNLPKLVTISAVEICVKQLSKGFFKRVPKLKEILLKSNHIEAIPTAVFRYSKINNLDLSYNRIHIIEDYAFSGMAKVTLLNLENNRLTEVGKTWFENSKIAEINLANNRITRITADAFTRTKSLALINLEYNKIHYIDKMFKLDGLKALLLAGNWLTDIQFARNLRLTLLDVSFNKISYINIDDVQRVRQLRMIPNPWQCACLRSFWSENKKRNILVEDSEELTKRWNSNTPICIVPDEDGFACTYSKDGRFSSVQDTYFKVVNYEEIGKYS